MKVVINSHDFKNAIAKVAPAVGKSTYFSALENIKISAANGMITATATNAEDFLNIDIHGRIIENGTHKELMRQKGYYYNLYMRQYEELSWRKVTAE